MANHFIRGTDPSDASSFLIFIMDKCDERNVTIGIFTKFVNVCTSISIITTDLYALRHGNVNLVRDIEISITRRDFITITA